MSAETTKILVDDVEYDAPLGGQLIEFLGSIGKDIPHFCYHPGLSIQASCRQCQVESKGKSSRPGLIVSCREKIVPEMNILTDSPAAAEARRGVMEFLLLNHPLDCPICDKAGECSLQDTAYDTGQGEGRSHEPRRNLPKRKGLGDTILLDNERCILCTRCIRFFEEVTEAPQLTVADRGDRSVLTTFLDEPLTGDYQGNIVDLCPVGALTLKKFRFESRVWFLKETKTICGTCSRGCNTIVETRDDAVLRVRPRHNADVNGYWMCDRGRLEFDVFNREDRWVEASIDGRATSLADACAEVGKLMREANGSVLAVLSPWATIEEGKAFGEAFGAEHGFLRPDPSGRADSLLQTDEPAPNVRGLSEECGLRPITADQLPKDGVVVLLGFGLFELLPESARQALSGVTLVHHAHVAGSIAPRVALPAATAVEKSGHWVNIDGRRQYVRAALRRPVTVPEDSELFAELGAALSVGEVVAG